MSILEQLRALTVVVADTGDIESIRKHRPRDATTNPSLLLAAAQLPQYGALVKEALTVAGPAEGVGGAADLGACLERLAVGIGVQILGIIPGRVSVEVDARLSFDTEGTVEAARRILALFRAEGIGPERVLVKMASTWEGIRAAERLEREGIHCNLTLLFSFAQAVACAEAGVTLISPFVGRILDWHKAHRGVDSIPAAEDPGVLSVRQIYDYYKRFGYRTEVMGASFRTTGEILELAGCDLLTIAPSLLAELEAMNGTLERKLDPERSKQATLEKVTLNEAGFRWLLNEDPMATEKLAEGIRKFAADLCKLEQYLRTLPPPR